MLNIQENILLAPYTTIKIGGPARFFCDVTTDEELVEAVKYAKDNDLKNFILGGGSNIVISDNGFDGLVIRILNTKYQIPASPAGGQDTALECDAGVNLGEVVRATISASLEGLQWASGIPGAVGGAIRGNAGAYGGTIADLIVNVRVFDMESMSVKNFSPSECQFSYRSSIFKDNENLAILGANFNLSPGNKDELEEKAREIIRKRTAKHPQASSAGSFFQNPITLDTALIKRFERDIGTVCRESKIPAGWIIDEVGLRGKKIGQVMVSHEHANFIINLGGGKAQDVIMLASIIKQKVRNELHIELKEEVKYVGF